MEGIGNQNAYINYKNKLGMSLYLWGKIKAIRITSIDSLIQLHNQNDKFYNIGV